MSKLRSIGQFLGGFTIILAFCLLNVWFGMSNPNAAMIAQATGICCIGACVLYLLRRRWHGDANTSSSGSVLRPLLYIFAFFLLLDAVSLLLGYGEEVIISWIILTVVLIVLVVSYTLFLLFTTWMRRRATHRIVIGQIAAVVRQNLPLATGIKLAAESERGAARRHLLRMSRLLAQGASLAEATQQGFTDCPALALSLIIAGERSGQLSLALEQAEEAIVERARRRDRHDVSVWPFLILVVFFMITIVSGIMVAIVPKFKEIFKDFGAPLPPITTHLINFCEFLAESGLLLILAILAVISLVAGIYLHLRPRRVGHPLWTSRVADSFRWMIPGWRSIEFSTGMAAALRTIRMGVTSGLDLATSARIAADIDVNYRLRPKISQFADLVAGGANPRVAAQRAGLGEVTGIALASGQRGADLDAGLRYAADYNEAMTNRLWILIRNLSWPITTFILGSMVAVVVVALFEPLVALIDATTKLWGR